MKILQKQNNFKVNKTQKGTASTLVESIRSNNSLKDKIKATLSLKEEYESPKKVPSFGPNRPKLITKPSYFSSRKNSYERPSVENC